MIIGLLVGFFEACHEGGKEEVGSKHIGIFYRQTQRDRERERENNQSHLLATISNQSLQWFTTVALINISC